MDYKKVFEAASAEPPMTEVISFKVDTRVKEDFLDICENRRIPSSKVLREMLTAFVKEAQSDD
jgi:antitoxin component of RelBE/YafQ-DinJ toxin-antitoxin module